MNKKTKTRNKKTRNKKNKKMISKKMKKIKYNHTKKKGGSVNSTNEFVSDTTDKLLSEMNKDKKPSSSTISDTFNKYSLDNLKRRNEEWVKEVKAAADEEKKRLDTEPQKSVSDKMGDMKNKAYDIGSKAYGNVMSFGKDKYNYLMNGVTSFGNQVISDEHKELIKAKLDELKSSGQISDKEYKHAMEQISRRDGVLGIKDSFMSMLEPVQEMVKVVGDWIFNTGDADFPSKQTHVKLLWVPKMYKAYVKGKIPDKNQKPDLEIDDFMVIIKEIHDSPMEKISSDMNSVDSLIANTLNGCIGSGCKDGIVSPPIIMEKDIHVTDSIRRKEILKAMKEQKEKDLAEANKTKVVPPPPAPPEVKPTPEPVKTIPEPVKTIPEPVPSSAPPAVQTPSEPVKTTPDPVHYKTLGIEPNADLEQIKNAYRKLALINHPDKGGDTEKFYKIQEAYEILKKQYDNE